MLVPCGASAQHGMRFIANVGQWPAEVTHRAELPGAFLWAEPGALLIHLYDANKVARAHGDARIDPAAPDNAFLDNHVVRLRFLSAGAGARNSGAIPLQGRYHYFLGNDPAKWASHATAHGQLVLHDVAPGCDAVFRQGTAGLKYDLVFAPGADPSALRCTYEGAARIELKRGSLIVRTSLGTLVERIPLAYQEIDGERRPVRCSYTLRDGVVGIRTGPYDRRLPLVVDPVLKFATYSGSVSNNFGYTATFDEAGFLYAGSTAFGAQYPVTVGAFQTLWAGGTTDIALTKYDTTGGFLVWSTYLGGSAAEMPHSLIVDANAQLHVLGTTGSNNFPTTPGAFDNTFGGGTPFTPAGLGLSYPNGSDMVVAKLSANGGQLLGSTYLGGSGNDGLNSAAGLKFNYADEVRGEVLLDLQGNIWVVSCTQSANMPVTASAAQPAFGGGSHDGYVARFNPSLTQLQYASYLGGTAADALYNGEIDQAGRLYVSGGTVSQDLPSSGNALQATYNGGSADAFAARIGTSGALERLTYWGSSAYDQAYFVELDGDGAVYLFGQTSAPSGQLVVNAPYNIPAGGQFVTKLSADLDALLMSSRFGSGDGNPDISPTAFLVDVCDKIYTSGWGSNAGGLGGQLSTNNLPVTPDAHQSSTDGNDLYLAVFDIDMNALTYATFYGGPVSPEHVDGGTSRFDRRGRVYQSVCAGCQGNSDFPTTPGAWSATNNSTGCNNGVLKFDFDAPLVIAAFTAPDTLCAPNAVSFTNLSSGATGYQWDFGDGNGSTAASPTHTYAAPGTYTVTLTATDPESCNGLDIATRTVVIDTPAPLLSVMDDMLYCGPLESFTLTCTSFGTATAYQWSTNALFTDTLNPDPQDSTAVIAPAVGGTYHVRATNTSSCVAQGSVTITVSLGAIALSGDSLLCGGDTATLALAGADPGSLIVWSPQDAILTGQGTPVATSAPTETTGYGVEVVAPSGCTFSATILVLVSAVDGSSVTASVDQNTVLPGTTVQLAATPIDGVTWSWSPADAVIDPTLQNPTASVQQTTTFTVTVSDGICTKDASVTVTVYELVCEEPDIFVPNSFSPNGDGVNDVLFVRGRHITDLEFLVFDRWGEKVFETRDQSVGWDGTFRGDEAGPAVFVYHLTAWCLDGQRYFKKGNVTLIR